MTAAVLQTLVDSVLVVDQVAPDEFVGGRPAESFGRIYGGEVAAQGMRAAAATVDVGRLVHSLHVNFLRLGDPGAPVRYAVERLRESAHFSTRFVRARQGEKTIASMTVSFQGPWSGLDYSAEPSRRLVDLPAPESLPRRADALAATFGGDVPSVATVPWPIDIRYIDRYPWAPGADPYPGNRLWVRADGQLGADPLEHASVLAYASDLTMYEPVIYAQPARVSWSTVSRGEIRGASLDHSIWFHRPFRIDDWLLHEHAASSAHGARGLALGRYFDRDGLLVASVAQEMAMFVDPEVNESSGQSG